MSESDPIANHHASATSGSVQVTRRIFADQLTPVLAYRRLVAPDDRAAPSFLFESVEQGGGVGRYSLIGVRPSLEVIARASTLEIVRHAASGSTVEDRSGTDPFDLLRTLSAAAAPVRAAQVPHAAHSAAWKPCTVASLLASGCLAGWLAGRPSVWLAS